MNEYKLVAPDIDRLLHNFDRGHMNPSVPTAELTAAMNTLFVALSDLAPLKSNEEAKSIWLQIPRGSINDYDSFEDLVEYGVVDTREEYEACWLEDYPSEVKWYSLVIVESFNKEGSLSFRAVALDNKTIISADMNRKSEPSESFTEEAAITLCSLITDAIAESMEKLRMGMYNDDVNEHLPYWFRKGVIKRNVLWEKDPGLKARALDGLAPETEAKFKQLLDSGINEPEKIGRIKEFTANDFFRACICGYKALNYDCGTLSPSEIYIRYADGRDEGLTGIGQSLNEGPGIDFDDHAAWNEWYFNSRRGGHPWEVIRGGNSTHVDLFVCHDQDKLRWELQNRQISDAEYKKRMEKSGYYFRISGKHRPLEAVTFYIALSTAGFPVVIEDAEEFLARYEGSDYIGIVPHYVIPKYCEDMFPDKYGHVIDFMHIFKEDLEIIGNAVEWLPEPEAKLFSCSKEGQKPEV